MSHDLTAIQLRGPVDAVAAVPYLLGFHPADSLVALALDGQRIVSVLRLDLPEEGKDDDDDPPALDDLADRVRRSGATACLLIGYDPASPVTTAVNLMTTALATVGVAVRPALRVADGRLYTLDGTYLPGATPDGTPFDPTTTAAAASATAAGYVALPDRAAFAAQLAPITGAQRAAFTAATKHAAHRLEALLDCLGIPPGTAHTDSDNTLGDPIASANALQRQAIAAWAFDKILQAMAVYRTGGNLDDDRAALLTVLLAIEPFRQFTLRRSTGEHWQIRMWTDLVRRAEPALTAGPANLLTMVALQAGDGMLAACAVQRALDADPDNDLAHLLDQLVWVGIDAQAAAALAHD